MIEKDLVIIGAGPAGSTAAIYATRFGIKPLVLGTTAPGGQLLLTHEIENFPGFPEPVSGYDLMEKMHRQFKRLGGELKNEEATKIELLQKPFTIHTSEGAVYSPKAIIIATGAKARWLGIPSEKKFIGRGISACATCDGFFFKGKKVCVVGGGDSAATDALFLSRFAQSVTIIHRRDQLRASFALAQGLINNPKINFAWDSIVEEILGEERVSAVRVKNVKTGALQNISAEGIFVAIGHEPDTKLFSGQLKLDEAGYIITDGKTKTSIAGVFAAGDVVDHDYRQAVTSAASGCIAAIEAQKYLSVLR
ncbi:MAG: thioredoxin-disulfide reductase [Elusimicrobia bacterium]|nr:thioredoxin-disulfide reductase [Elusimicrobiota bacterium]